MEVKYNKNGNEIVIKEIPMFQSFKRGNTQYLAVKSDNGIRVIDHNGNNYGGFYDLESFDKYYKDGKVIALDGNAKLNIVLY